MLNLQGITNFIDDLVGGLQLISFAIAIGSILWLGVVSRICLKTQDARHIIILQSIKILQVSAYTLAITQLIELILHAVIVAVP